MASSLTKNYKPRVSYDSNYPISHPNNAEYVRSLAVWGMARIKSSAKAYHKKHKGVKDNGKPGKQVTITIDDLKEIIIKSDGKSPNGADIYFGPTGILLNPGKAEEFKMITKEQRSRFPSFDRIDSSKGYIKENLQLVTKSYNLGKSSDDIAGTELAETATLKWNGVEVQITNFTSSFLANTIKQLVN